MLVETWSFLAGGLSKRRERWSIFNNSLGEFKAYWQ